MTAEKAAKIAEKARKKEMCKDDKEAKKAIKRAAKAGYDFVDVSWITSEYEEKLKSKGYKVETIRRYGSLCGDYIHILWG